LVEQSLVSPNDLFVFHREAQHPTFSTYASLVLHIAKLQLNAKKFEGIYRQNI